MLARAYFLLFISFFVCAKASKQVQRADRRSDLPLVAQGLALDSLSSTPPGHPPFVGTAEYTLPVLDAFIFIHVSGFRLRRSRSDASEFFATIFNFAPSSDVSLLGLRVGFLVLSRPPLS